MLRVWHSPVLRPTMDIDMLGKTRNKEADIIAQIQDILTIDVEEDGLVFDPNSIQAERITEGMDYDGIRIRFLGALGSVRINMQIDIGFGDVVFPEPEKLDLPTMLNSRMMDFQLFATALDQALVAVITLWVGSALLFRHTSATGSI